MKSTIEPRPGDLARARVLAEIFHPHYFWAVEVRRNGRIEHARVLAANAEEATHRAAIAGEVLGVEKMT